MSQDFSQMYNTQPNFNKNIVEKWILERKIEEIKHWFKHGSSHKKLAIVAFSNADT